MDRILNTVIHPELEPGVINHDMIKEAIEADFLEGEVGKLQKLEEINYEDITSIRLESRNILRIDHIWVLPNLTKLSLNFNKLDKIENLDELINLKDLNLSFNYIKKIENLDNLKQLETLSLFSNEIEKVEGIDALEKLIILSLGNNNINTTVGIERLRFLNELHCLNLEGNPIAKGENPLREYIAAFLPNLKYYEYSFIMEKEREEALVKYKKELKQLLLLEEEEYNYRKKQAQMQEIERKLAISFVQQLIHHKLFENLFEGDDEGRALLLVGQEAERLKNEYQADFYEVTQTIFRLGLDKYEERAKEIKMFNDCIIEAQEKVQKHGQEIVDEFEIEKEEILTELREILANHTGEDAEELQQEASEIAALEERLDEEIEKIWQDLMREEIELFENVQEAIYNFKFTIQDMIDEFTQEAQTHFVNLRDISVHFSKAMLDVATEYINFMSTAQADDRVPKELKDCLHNKDQLNELVTGMQYNHNDKIDSCEDNLVERAKEWVVKSIDDMNQSEITRNRAKIMEINYYLEQSKDAFEHTKNEEPTKEANKLDVFESSISMHSSLTSVF